jgi:diphthine-ammonia ligase
MPTLLIGIPALPKGALVEKQVLIHTGRRLVQDEDEDDGMRFESRVVLEILYSLHAVGRISLKKV